MAAKGAGGHVELQGKRSYSNVISTPGRNKSSPQRKQQKQGKDGGIYTSEAEKDVPEILLRMQEMMDKKFEEMTSKFESIISKKLDELEKKFDVKITAIKQELKELKDDYNESLNYVEQSLEEKIASTFDYAIKNEQYSRKNNLRIYGLKEERDEDLEGKVLKFAKDELNVELQDEEIEIVHRVGRMQRAISGTMSVDDSGAVQSNVRPRPVIVKFLSNKSKIKVLVKNRNLKGKQVSVAEDMAPEIANRLKQLKGKSLVEAAWFVNRMAMTA